MFTVKDDNFTDIVMSNLFANLEKPLMVEIIRKRTRPGKNTEIRFDKTAGTTLENDFSIFLCSGGREFSDINLVLDGHIIPAHKSILSARCSYFQAMFRSFMPPDNTVNVKRSVQNSSDYQSIHFFNSISDSNRRHFAFTGSIQLAVTIHLLWRDENAARRFLVFIPSILFLR